MMISSRGRYALRVMTDLAEHNTGAYIPLTDIARRKQVSEKYLESIVASLSKSGYLDALRGKGGGYRLNRPVEAYTLDDILSVTEGSLAPIACVDGPCEHAAECRTLPVWQGLDDVIHNYLKSVTLADIIAEEHASAKEEL
ncbi:MAG: Rrf2 family transcriptional regulator [Clostridia bacterium]|nr:Rrf2 family transcriptional regulator [Clostridia bacterium]